MIRSRSGPRTALPLERLLSALLRIVELHRGWIERLGVELPPGPLKRRLVLLMIGIRDDPKELGIAVDTASVLRRTPAFTGHAARVLAIVVG